MYVWSRHCYLVGPSHILGWRSGNGGSRRRFVCHCLGNHGKNHVGASGAFILFYFKHRSVRIVCVELRAEEGEDTSEQGKALSETVFGRKQPLEERPLYYMQTWGRASLVRRVVHRGKSMLTIFFVTVHTIAKTQSSQGLEAVIDRNGISAEVCG